MQSGAEWQIGFGHACMGRLSDATRQNVYYVYRWADLGRNELGEERQWVSISRPTDKKDYCEDPDHISLLKSGEENFLFSFGAFTPAACFLYHSSKYEVQAGEIPLWSLQFISDKLWEQNTTQNSLRLG